MAQPGPEADSQILVDWSLRAVVPLPALWAPRPISERTSEPLLDPLALVVQICATVSVGRKQIENPDYARVERSFGACFRMAYVHSLAFL